MLSPIFGDKLYLNLVYFFLPLTILDFAFVFGFYLNFCSEKRQTVLQAKSFYICLCIVLIYRASRVFVLYTSQRGYSKGSPAFFIKEKSELQQFVSDCRML